VTQQNADERPGIAAAVVIHGGRVLMVRRRVSEGRLSWQFPTGEAEPGETREDAAVRETQKETGLVVKLLGERVHPATGRWMSYTACETLGGIAHVADSPASTGDHGRLTSSRRSGPNAARRWSR
jgi:8-oxo-dGTP diphosphatase